MGIKSSKKDNLKNENVEIIYYNSEHIPIQINSNDSKSNRNKADQKRYSSENLLKSTIIIKDTRTPTINIIEEDELEQDSLISSKSYLNCEICAEPYNESEKAPVIYSCGHTVCKLCSKRKNNNKCAFCNQKVSINPNKNFALLDIVRKNKIDLNKNTIKGKSSMSHRGRSVNKDEKINKIIFSQRAGTLEKPSLSLVTNNELNSWRVDRNNDKIKNKLNNETEFKFLEELYFLSGSWDSTIKLWNTSKNKSEFTLSNHDSYISALIVLGNNILISASWDNTIRKWDLEDRINTKTILAHEDKIISFINLNKNKFASCSKDLTIKIWEVEELSHICTINIDSSTSSILCMINIDNNCFMLGTEDNLIIKLDVKTLLENLDNNEIVENSIIDSRVLDSYKLNGHSHWVSCLLLLNLHIFLSGSYDNTIKIWDIDNNTCIGTLVGHVKYVLSLSIYSNSIVISGSADKTIKMWNVFELKCIKTFYGHSNWVNTSVKLNDSLIVSGSDDNTIKIWDIHKGVCAKTFKEHTLYVHNLCIINFKRTIN